MSSITKTRTKKIISTSTYPIILGQDLFSDNRYFELKPNQKVFVVTDEIIAKWHLDPLLSHLRAQNIETDHLILPSGEHQKTIAVWQSIIETLIEKEHTRHSVLVALGGGVICDLVGFTAATFQRGIRFISIPTTLLSQVDASIGGKTAINHPLAKNLIGAFHFPSQVMIDINSLATLDPRQFSSGIAEIIKYGVVLDKDFFEWLEHYIEKIVARDPEILLRCIEHCCHLKTKLVAQDEREESRRALLNFGHTFGHAIETLLGFGNWLHGEAVSVGMLMASHLSHRLGMASNEDVDRLTSLLLRANLPVRRPNGIDASAYLPVMRRDKKRLGSHIRCVLIRGIGNGEIADVVDMPRLIEAIQSV